MALVAGASMLALFACGPDKPPPQPPESTAAAPEPTPEPKPAAEPAAEPAAKPETAPEPEAKPEAKSEPDKASRVPEGSFAVGTFNLEWAFDAIDVKRPKKARPNVPKDDDVWEWKRDRIVEVLIAERLDIFVLTELGGERELGDIVSSISINGGYDYQYSWLDNEDKFSGQHVAIVSRFPLRNERRYDTLVTKHVATDIELPNGQEISVIAVHMKEGKNKGAVIQRHKEARSIRRFMLKEKRKRPVILLGTVGTTVLPSDEDYKESAPGIISNRGKSCYDSGSDAGAQKTNVDDNPSDRIFVCNMEAKGSEVSGRDKIIREEVDPPKTPWPTIEVDKAPHRDISDHFVVWTEVVIPPKGAEPKAEDEQ